MKKKMKKIYGYRFAVAEQRLMWDDLRKSINNLVETVSESNIKVVGEELVSKNLVWGRGLFCRAILRSSSLSVSSSPVLGALVSMVNSKFPDMGYLLLKRILFQVRIAYESDDTIQLLPLSLLLANLVNQYVVHETAGLEFLFLLLQELIPTKEIIEIAVSFVTVCGWRLSNGIQTKLDSVFDRFDEILHVLGDDYKSRLLIEGLFALRKSGFKKLEEDIVETEDQVIHEISSYNDLDPELSLDLFQPYSDVIFNDNL